MSSMSLFSSACPCASRCSTMALCTPSQVIPSGMASRFAAASTRLSAAIRRAGEFMLPPLALVLAPLLKLLLMDFNVELRDSGLEPLLCFRHSSVVDGRANLFQEEAKQSARGEVADGFLHVLSEIPLYGGDGFLPGFFAQFNRHDALLLGVLLLLLHARSRWPVRSTPLAGIRRLRLRRP